MLVPTSQSLLISNKQNDQSFNTIKIDFSKMSFINSTKDRYTQCRECRALLTIEDKKHVNNKHIDADGKFIWICRFCKKQNKSSEIYFVSSNFKYCLQKNIPKKIVPPIILFLIDVSGSMTTSIYTGLWNKKQQKNNKSSLLTSQLKKIIQESLMRKKQTQYLEQLQKSFGSKYENQDNLQHFSKLSFLFAIIQYHLKALRNSKQKSQFRIGFIFLSDSLVVLKGARQKSIPMYIHDTDDMAESYPFKKQKIDFNDFQKIYEKGKQYDRYFGDSKFNNFDISKLAIQHIKTGGKTALGPAMALALGIISQHDQGSKILLLTDSMPNYGVLSTKESSPHYKNMSQIISKTKATLGVFRLVNNEFQNLTQNAQFQNFLISNNQQVKKIQISLNPSVTEQVVQAAIKSLKNLINHQSVGDSYKLHIITDNQKISLNKFKYDNLDYRNLRFITSHSKNWIQVDIDKKNICQNDLLFPIMTQLVIQYDDVFLKERCLFMSYTQQRLLKPHINLKCIQENQSTDEAVQYLQEVNIQNIQNIIDMQNMKKFMDIKDTQDFRKRTFRNELKNIIIKINNTEIKSIDCQSLNDYALLQNKIIEGKLHNQSEQFSQQIKSDYQTL